MKRAVKWLTALTGLLLVAFVSVLYWHQAVFDEYSRDFGGLSPQRFEALNALMDKQRDLARALFVALAVSDVALIVASARERAFLVCAVSVLFALVLGCFLLLAMASVSASMVG